MLKWHVHDRLDIMKSFLGPKGEAVYKKRTNKKQIYNYKRSLLQ